MTRIVIPTTLGPRICRRSTDNTLRTFIHLVQYVPKISAFLSIYFDLERYLCQDYAMINSFFSFTALK